MSASFTKAWLITIHLTQVWIQQWHSSTGVADPCFTSNLFLCNPFVLVQKLNLNVSATTYQNRLFCSSCFPADAPEGDTGIDTARTRRTRGSWCSCRDAASGSSRRRTSRPPTAASWWFLPPPPPRNPPPLRNGQPIHRCSDMQINLKKILKYKSQSSR